MSTYLIFNQLRIIHPQFRPKSRTSVLEPSQNFLSNQNRAFLLKRDGFGVTLDFRIKDGFSSLALTIVIEYSIVVVRARIKEKVPTDCGSRGQLLDY
ncbi:neurotrimin-like isoform X2 [Vespula squamosa]|uniref:Neurotrimin-like isoform X2 n=1 Tax=Vespula squamosa TaxID=30214 RepID=A0ABD2A2A9_VESSQ